MYRNPPKISRTRQGADVLHNPLGGGKEAGEFAPHSDTLNTVGGFSRRRYRYGLDLNKFLFSKSNELPKGD